jgi:hypothetical protein
MPFHKGRKKTGGRQKGVPNKSTREKREKLLNLIPSGKDPLTFFLEVLADRTAPFDVRAMAAKEAAPYCHPKLASVESRSGGKTHEDRLEELHKLLEDGP